MGHATIDEFITASKGMSLDKNTPIYIDSQLGDVKGEVESEKVFNAGFLNLHIATGLSESDIERPHWIKSVVGKSPVSHT